MLINILLIVGVVTLCMTAPLVCVLLIQEILFKNLRIKYFKKAMKDVEAIDDLFSKSMKGGSMMDTDSTVSFYFVDDDDKKVH